MSQQSINKKLLQTFVPVNSLTSNHLDQLLAKQDVALVPKGEKLFTIGDEDNTTIYLLSGEVELVDSMGRRTVISSGGIESWHPVEHFQPRRSTATALSDASIVKFDSYRLDTILSWDQSAGYMILDIASNRQLDQDADWMIKLLKSNLFYSVPPANIQQIFRRLKPVPLAAGDAVIRQGDGADCCYFIKKGVCEVSVLAPGAEQPVTVAMLEAGQVFGEEALLSETTRNATITMATEGILMRLDKQDFNELLKEPVISAIGFSACQEIVAGGGVWLDVRTPDEFEGEHLRGAQNMPLNVLRLKSRLLDAKKHYIVYCDTGRRSTAATFLLKNAGFRIDLLEGGLQSLTPAQRKQFLVDD
jgi:CRP-like cAMP-binding protein/rhodanese-related sulfurtransferase